MHLQPSAFRERAITETVSVILNLCVTTLATRSEPSIREGVHHGELSTMRRSTESSRMRWEFVRSFTINPDAICAITSNVPGIGWERSVRELADALRTHKWSAWSGKQLCAGTNSNEVNAARGTKKELAAPASARTIRSEASEPNYVFFTAQRDSIFQNCLFWQGMATHVDSLGDQPQVDLCLLIWMFTCVGSRPWVATRLDSNSKFRWSKDAWLNIIKLLFKFT